MSVYDLKNEESRRNTLKKIKDKFKVQTEFNNEKNKEEFEIFKELYQKFYSPPYGTNDFTKEDESFIYSDKIPVENLLRVEKALSEGVFETPCFKFYFKNNFSLIIANKYLVKKKTSEKLEERFKKLKQDRREAMRKAIEPQKEEWIKKNPKPDENNKYDVDHHPYMFEDMCLDFEANYDGSKVFSIQNSTKKTLNKEMNDAWIDWHDKNKKFRWLPSGKNRANNQPKRKRYLLIFIIYAKSN